ncbi:MAG: RagB/SusD family nutrient uptake outer membrane protein [Niabella sp.]
MKKVFYYYIVATVLMLVSCNKFLDTSPKDTITTDNYYQNETQLNAALTNVYGIMMSWCYGRTGNALSHSLDYSDEDILNYSSTLNSDPLKMGGFAYTYTNSVLDGLWQALYSAIASVNLLEANLHNADATTSADTRNYIMAQALFLRGYAYYLLGSHWGGVPLRTSTLSIDNLSIARSSLAETYAQAVADMEAALPYLKTPAETGTPSRISQTAAKAVLARVFLTMASPGTKIGLNEPKYYDSVIYYTVFLRRTPSLMFSMRGIILRQQGV